MNSSTTLQAKSFSALIALLFGGAVLAQGCGGDDNPIPTPGVSGGSGGTAGSGGKGGKSSSGGGAGESEGGNGTGNEGGSGNDGSGATGGSSASGGTGNNTGGSGNTGNRGGTGNTGNQGGEGAEGNQGGEGNQPGVDCDVRGTNGCYRCEPNAQDPAPAFPHSANEQFLNHCDDSKGARFVNEDRIPGFTGTDNLPALP